MHYLPATSLRMRIAMAATASIIAISLPRAAGAQPAADGWRFTVTPYLWLPGVDASLRYGPPPGPGVPNVDVAADSVLGALEGAFMINLEARRGNWLVFADYVYVDLESDESSVRSIDFGPGSPNVGLGGLTVDIGTTTQLSGDSWSIFSGRGIDAGRVRLGVIGGFRNLDLDASSDWRLSADVAPPGGGAGFAASGAIGRAESLTDIVIGVRGRAPLGDSAWFVPFHLDAGGGDSSLTWQWATGVGRAFEFGDAVLAYRYLAYETGGGLIDDLRFAGIAAGVTFRF